MFADLERACSAIPRAGWHGLDGPAEATVWRSRDDLGSEHLVAAMQDALARCSVGGAHNVCGTRHDHVLLKPELAGLHCKDAALIFGSGCDMDEAVLSTTGMPPPGGVTASSERG
jgi:5-aminolevulinate synthase